MPLRHLRQDEKTAAMSQSPDCDREGWTASRAERLAKLELVVESSTLRQVVIGYLARGAYFQYKTTSRWFIHRLVI